MDRSGWLGLVAACAAAALLGGAEPPADAVRLYNDACMASRGGDPDRGAALLMRALKAGFTNISHVRRDPDLRPLHQHPVYRAILAASDAADRPLAEERLRHWRAACGDDAYRLDADPARQITFVTALPDADQQALRRMLAAHADFVENALFAYETGDPVPAPYHVVVVVPSAADLARFVDRPHAAGVYRHHRRELIAADPRSLRHEFVHLLHHRHMDALGQEQALWIQEGLALLFEDYTAGEDGSLVVVENDRHDAIRRLAEGDRLMPWPVLLALDEAGLRAEAARAYPQLWSMFRFIAEQGDLRAWYRGYIAGFDEDPTGSAALQATFGCGLPELEARWRLWLSRPQAPSGPDGLRFGTIPVRATDPPA